MTFQRGEGLGMHTADQIEATYFGSRMGAETPESRTALGSPA
jgi:hypothetical protein